MRRPIIAGNWKMFKTVGESVQFVQVLAQQLKDLQSDALPEVMICPPFTALSSVQDSCRQLSSSISVVAQTMGAADQGAYTGEISPLMLSDLQVRHVLLGHSERRQYFNETDSSVADKAVLALAHNITPVVCVGETLEEREAGTTDTVVTRQIKAVLDRLVPDKFEKLVVAYEPVWAIGTGKVCDAEEANRVCGVIRQQMGSKGADVRILYGGSVKPDNAEQLMRYADIDGALVGGASLDASSFYQIITASCKAVARL